MNTTQNNDEHLSALLDGELSDRDAIRHIFRVAASLDSMVVGEPQILGQMKAAYAAAHELGTLHGILDDVLTRAFGVAKRVRSETEIGRSAVSVSYAAVELARVVPGLAAIRRRLEHGRILRLAGVGHRGQARHREFPRLAKAPPVKGEGEDGHPPDEAVHGQLVCLEVLRPGVEAQQLALAQDERAPLIHPARDLGQLHRPLVEVAVDVGVAAVELERVARAHVGGQPHAEPARR